MSAQKALDLALQQGLIDAQVAELLRGVFAAAGPIPAETVVQLLVAQGHLTQFQAKKLLADANGPSPDTAASPAPLAAPAPDAAPITNPASGETPPAQPPPTPQPAAKPTRPSADLFDFADDDEEIVMLEAVAPTTPAEDLAPSVALTRPAERQSSPTPAAAKASPSSKPPAAPQAAQPTDVKPSPPSAKSSPVPQAPPQEPPPPISQPPKSPKKRPAAATIDYTEGDDDMPPPALEVVTPAKLKPVGLKPLNQGLQPIETLQPLEQLQPLEELQPVEMLVPLGGGIDPLTGQLTSAGGRQPKIKGKKNPWDSTLLLLGGGLLGVFAVAFTLLYFALTRGSAAESFATAEQEYREGSYTAAIAAYDSFLSRYPKDPNSSLARVRRGLAQIRLVSDGDRDPSAGLKAAQQVLPQIEEEAQFAEARVELASILPHLAEGFVEQARTTNDSAARQQLVERTEEAMELIANPHYLPPSLRKEIDGRIANILDQLKAARRSIDQQRELETALAAISAAAAKNRLSEGYTIHSTLLKTYPTLATNDSLAAAAADLAERERELVTVEAQQTTAIVDDAKAPAARIVLSSRTGGSAPGAANKREFMMLDGAVYAVDVASGKILWRRYVGHETQNVPLPIGADSEADALVSDARTHSLLRLDGASGKLVWRQDLAEPFAAPLVVQDRVIVSLASGRLVDIALSDGLLTRTVRLPQPVRVGACFDARSGRIYQLGEHSTIFALNATSLECEETHYLGHTAGSILAPPAAVLDVLLAPESPADSFSLLHVLKKSDKDHRLTEVGKPFRLKGRITTALSVSGRRVLAVTDLGQVSVFEVEASTEETPVREIARTEATEARPVRFYHCIDGNRMWVAGRRCSMYEVQSSLQQLARGWTLHQDDAFIAPLRKVGGAMVHVRRRPQSDAVLLEACDPSDGHLFWTTNVAAPVVAVAASGSREQLVAITSNGQVFEAPKSALAVGVYDEPAYSPPMGTGSWQLRDATELQTGNWFCSGFEMGPQAMHYDLNGSDARARYFTVSAAGRSATAPPTFYQGGLLAPVNSGRVLLLTPETGREMMLPFQPEIELAFPPKWPQATRLPPDGSAAAVSDGIGRLFRIGVSDQPQRHLEAQAEQPIAGNVTRPLAAVGDTLYLVLRNEAGNTLQAYDPATLMSGVAWPLAGTCHLGPVAVQERVYVADEQSLYCLTADQQLSWKVPLADGELAQSPRVQNGDLIVVHRSGVLRRVSGETGKEVARTDLAEPLGRASVLLGPRMLVAGADGVLHLVVLPKAE